MMWGGGGRMRVEETEMKMSGKKDGGFGGRMLNSNLPFPDLPAQRNTDTHE